MGEDNVRISFEIAPEHREETVHLLSILGINNIEIVEPEVYNTELVDEVIVGGETIRILTEGKMRRFGWRQEAERGLQNGSSGRVIGPLFRNRLRKPDYSHFHDYYYFTENEIALKAAYFPDFIDRLKKNCYRADISGSGIEGLGRRGIKFLAEYIKPFIKMDTSPTD